VSGPEPDYLMIDPPPGGSGKGARMSDIMDRLRQMADLFEAQHAPHNMVLHLRAAADEIERQRAAALDHLAHVGQLSDEIERLRAGGCARDQSTTQYCAEAARLAAEIERLRAALERIAFGKYHWEADAQEEARAALEGK
jgi:hypothetical protein